MENLNKDNFWNEAYSKYPAATERFCKWIDKYKAEHDWNALIGRAVKFHDLPWELQVGLLMRFMVELPTGHPAKLLIFCFGDMEKAGIYFGQYLKELDEILNRMYPAQTLKP